MKLLLKWYAYEIISSQENILRKKKLTLKP